MIAILIVVAVNAALLVLMAALIMPKKGTE